MYLLYHKKSCKTGKILGTALGIRRGLGRSALTHGPLVRWGSAVAFDVGTVLNQPEAIVRASDKLVALRAMEAAGVRIPDVVTQPYGQALADGTWLGRKRHGFGGTDIRVIENGSALSGDSHFYTRYIPNKREYRLHVFRNQVIRLQGKWLDHPEQHTNPYVQNYSQGFRFRTPEYRLNKEREEMAIKAVEALGLDFGAVDLLVGQDGLTYILEVNTAPKCSPLTARVYVDAIRNYLVGQGHTMPTPVYSALEAARGTTE